MCAAFSAALRASQWREPHLTKDASTGQAVTQDRPWPGCCSPNAEPATSGPCGHADGPAHAPAAQKHRRVCMYMR